MEIQAAGTLSPTEHYSKDFLQSTAGKQPQRRLTLESEPSNKQNIRRAQTRSGRLRARYGYIGPKGFPGFLGNSPAHAGTGLVHGGSSVLGTLMLPCFWNTNSYWRSIFCWISNSFEWTNHIFEANNQFVVTFIWRRTDCLRKCTKIKQNPKLQNMNYIIYIYYIVKMCFLF